jgi:uncharacterized protein YjbI with pentapeptide repeats
MNQMSYLKNGENGVELNDGVFEIELQNIFNHTANGSPTEISKAGCLALLKRSKEIGGDRNGHLLWNEWRLKPKYQTPYDGITKTYSNTVDFSDVDFSKIGITDFVGFIFGNGTNFSNSRFPRDFKFNGAVIGYQAKFDEASFEGNVEFSGAMFGSGCSFVLATFKGGAFFNGVHWEQLQWTYRSQKDKIKKFSDNAALIPSRFFDISFNGATFEGAVFFSGRTFQGATSFCPSESKGIKKVVEFKKVPIFHNCTFHQNTRFDDAKFPPPTGDSGNAKAYRTLKLAFSNQQSAREEQDFFAREMKEETVEYGLKAKQALDRQFALFDFTKNGTAWLLHKIYKWTSNYGLSFWSPTFWLIGSVCLFAYLYAFLNEQTSLCLSFDVVQAKKWVQLSVLQTFPFPGFDELAKNSLADLLKGKETPLAITMFIVIQKIGSLLLLFLSGLALRNLFKLK